MWKYILFDLDGTLTDPKIGITKSVEYALRHYGIKVENLDDLVTFIGPPLKESFQVFYGFDDDKAIQAVDKFREYFSTTGIYENTIYDGIVDMLEALKKQGKKIILATSKPKIFAVVILKYFAIEQYFDFVSGSELDGTRSKKAEVIKYVLENYPIKDINSTIMIGDREHDVIGAKKTGITSVGVLYGYGDFKELSNAKADIIVQNINELTALLIGD